MRHYLLQLSITCFSYVYGIVRMPNGEVHPVDYCDLSLPHIAEDRTYIPKKYTLNFRGT